MLRLPYSALTLLVGHQEKHWPVKIKRYEISHCDNYEGFSVDSSMLLMIFE